MKRLPDSFPENHPLVTTLVRLHAKIGGEIFENKKRAEKLATDMKHVEAVIRMLSPDFKIASIAVRRRYKGNPWFKRGTLLRLALDALRAGTAPMTSKEVALAMLASKGVLPSAKEANGLAAAIQTAFRKHEGKSVEVTDAGLPTRWQIARVADN